MSLIILDYFFSNYKFCQLLVWGFMSVKGRRGRSIYICMHKFKFPNAFEIKHFHVSNGEKKKTFKMLQPETAFSVHFPGLHCQFSSTKIFEK